MSYIGRQNLGGAYRQLDDISSNFNSSTTAFTMQVNSTNVSVGDVNQIILSLGGVIQKPGTDFTVSGSTLTFTTEPASGTSFFAILLGSDNGGTVTPTDGSVTGDKVASTGAFTIGAAGTASSIAGLPIYVDSTNNSVYTFDVSGTDDSAQNNTAFGLNAADAITTADSVTVFGRNAGSAITTASSSTFFGKEAGVAVTEGTNNVLMGVNAGHSLTTGGSNIAIGATALDGCDTESNNLAIGRDALGGSIAGGELNVCVGNYTGDAITSGDNNVFVGYNVGSGTTTGASNFGLGYQALNVNSEGSRNIGIGHGAVQNSDTENDNIGIGYTSIQVANSGAEKNVSVGNFNLDVLTSGDGNTSIGYGAGSTMTTGYYNTLVGRNAGVMIDDGHSNTIMGWQSGEQISSGERNVCIGRQAGDEVTTGNGNIFIGYDSTIGSVSTASGNISIGDQNQHSNGNYEITIGYQVQGLGGNSVTIGSPSGKVYNVFSLNNTWTQTSDERAKNIIETNTVGLDFIKECRVVDFTWKPNTELPTEWNEHRDENFKDTETVCNGFIAQEVKAALEKVGVDPEKYGVWDEQLDGVQSVAREMFVLPLVNAVKELAQRVEELENK